MFSKNGGHKAQKSVIRALRPGRGAPAKFLFLLLLISINKIYCWSFFGNSQTNNIKKPITIIIDPAGDAKNTGREIDDNFERGLTLQCAQEIKKSLEGARPELSINKPRIILTRFPGETLEPFQNASFANRLQPDLYINLNLYKETDQTKKVYIFYLIYNPVTDQWEKRNSDLTLIPFDQSYRFNLKKTQNLAKLVHNSLKNIQKNNFLFFEPIGLPFKPLIGITCPAIAIEVGIFKKEDCTEIITLLTEAIESIIKNIEI